MKQYKTFGDTAHIPDAPGYTQNYNTQQGGITPIQDLYDNDMVPSGTIREFNRTPYEYQNTYQKSGMMQQERQSYPLPHQQQYPMMQQQPQQQPQVDICSMTMSHLKMCKMCAASNRAVKQDRQNVMIIIVLLLVIMFLITKLTDYANKN